jgi:hypothetical protein
MNFFNFFKPRINLSTELNNLEKKTSSDLFDLIEGIRKNLEIQFCSEFDPEPINIYKHYENHTDEKFYILVKASLKNGYYYKNKEELLNIEEELNSIKEQVFSYALVRAKKKKLGNELDILLKGNDKDRLRLFEIAEIKKELANNILTLCTSKKILLNKSLSVNEIKAFMISSIIDTVKNLTKNN